MKQRELEKLLAKWQKRLRLQDWIIKIGQYKAKDFILKDASGEIVYNNDKKQALIKIIEESDFPDGCILPLNIERTMVHELLHLHFGLLREGTYNNPDYETLENQAIDSIAFGFIPEQEYD